MKRFGFVAVALTLVACVAFVGCAKKASGSRNGLVKAAGVLTYNGAPVEGATIEMRSMEGTENSVAVAVTDSEGKFELTTDRPGDGAFPGKYKTVVMKQVKTIDGKTLEELAAENVGEDPSYNKDSMVVENQLPEQYLDPENTPLIVEIPAKGDKNLKIELTD